MMSHGGGFGPVGSNKLSTSCSSPQADNLIDSSPSPQKSGGDPTSAVILPPASNSSEVSVDGVPLGAIGTGTAAASRKPMSGLYGRGKPRPKPAKPVEVPDLGVEAAAAVGSQPTKTPVSVLQELCVKRQITPKYDLIQIEGSVHEPTFKYRVTVGEYVEHGTGQSKKKAKHAAAKAVLDKLIGNSGAMKNGGDTVEADAAKPEVMSPYEDGIPGNPVGALQEFCMSRRLPPPIYELSAEDGLPHERLFTIDCVIGKNRASGTGKSKKLAKRQAAHKLLLSLKDTQPERAQATSVLDEDDELQNGLGKYASLKDAKISVMNPAHTPKLLQFHKSLMAAKGENITSLKTTSLNKEGLNYPKFLQDIAREQNFEVTFVDIEETAKSGKYQCLVQLSTLPVAVCYGSGEDKTAAQAAAAHNALEYLKIMTK